MKGNRGHSKAKTFGRAVDNAVQRAVKGQPTGRLQTDAQKAMRHFFNELQRANVVIDDVQVAVRNQTVRTQLDGLGHDYENRKVVIELKTSLHPLSFYNKHYQSTVPPGQPNILPHIPNTMYWRHQLQAGFGVACLGGNSRGLVVVVCSDGAMHHWVQSQATLPTNFEHPVVSDTPSVRLLKWPGHENVKHLVRGLGRFRKGRGKEPATKYGIAHYTNAVVGAISKPGKRERMQRSLIKKVGQQRSPPVPAYVIINTNDTLRIVPA